jgi:hypothetical protein
MSKLLAPLLFASPLALTSVIIGVNQSPVYANVEVQGAVVNLWPTTADAVPTLGQGKLASFLIGTSFPALSNTFLPTSSGGRRQLIAYNVGSAVDVLWNGRWYPAIVTEVIRSG